MTPPPTWKLSLDEIAAGRKDRVSELAEFYYGSDQVTGLHPLVTGWATSTSSPRFRSAVSRLNLQWCRYGPYMKNWATTSNTTTCR